MAKWSMAKPRMKPTGTVSWVTPNEANTPGHVRSYGEDEDGNRWERTTYYTHGVAVVDYRHLGHATDDKGEWTPWDAIPIAWTSGE